MPAAQEGLGSSKVTWADGETHDSPAGCMCHGPPSGSTAAIRPVARWVKVVTTPSTSTESGPRGGPTKPSHPESALTASGVADQHRRVVGPPPCVYLTEVG